MSETTTTDARIRRAMANSTNGETSRITLPAWARDLDLDAVDDVLGWRDPKARDRGVLLLPVDDGLAGIALRAGERAARATAMCVLCRTTHVPGRVELLVARRPGSAGRNGDTVGTYLCSDLQCAQHVRSRRPPRPCADARHGRRGATRRPAGTPAVRAGRAGLTPAAPPQSQIRFRR